jgi:hypothetical protein
MGNVFFSIGLSSTFIHLGIVGVTASGGAEGNKSNFEST